MLSDHVSVNYSFNVIDERPETIRQTVAYHRELEEIFGADRVEPAIFFIGLQPHTHLEQYGFDQGLIKPGYNPMSMMPWTARKLLWNPEPMGGTFGQVCLEAFDRNPDDFGRTVWPFSSKYGVSCRRRCTLPFMATRRWPRPPLIQSGQDVDQILMGLNVLLDRSGNGVLLGFREVSELAEAVFGIAGLVALFSFWHRDGLTVAEVGELIQD